MSQRKLRQWRIAWVQNLKRSVVCMLRIVLAAAGSPNRALFTVVFQEVKVTWLSALVESTRRSKWNRSPTRNVRPKEASRVNWAGPITELRPEFPHSPGSGGVYAAGLRYKPGGA